MDTQNLPKKALLILDNAPSHPPANELIKKTDEGNIWVMFMPPNVTPLIQPMDQNAIRLVKLHYKNSLLTKIVATGSLKQLDVYDEVSLIALAWQKISAETLKKCWRNILRSNFEDFDEEDEMNQDKVLCLRQTLSLANKVFPEVDLQISILIC